MRRETKWKERRGEDGREVEINITERERGAMQVAEKNERVILAKRVRERERRRNKVTGS